MRILAVEDEPFIRELLEIFVERAGFDDLETVDSGAAALSRIAESEEPYDCFLLDISMPEMDGITLCRHIRALPGHAQAQIIMLTAMVDQRYINDAFAAGATDYATKPFDLNDLGNRLNAAKSNIEVCADGQNATPEPLGHIHTDASVCGAADLTTNTRILGQLTFRNYMSRMARTRLQNAHVFAITIADMEALRRATSTEGEGECEGEDNGRVLSLISSVLDDCLPSSNTFYTYIGNGTLFVVEDRAEGTGATDLAATISFALNDRWHLEGYSLAAMPRVTVGQPVRLTIENVADVDALVDQARFLSLQKKRNGPQGPFAFLRQTLSSYGWSGK